MNTFRERLQQLMDKKNFSQADLAKGIGINKSRVHEWIKGTIKQPQRKTLRNIANYSGCDLDWLETGNGEPFPKQLTEKTADRRFVKRRQEDLAKEVTGSARRDRFKMQCLGLFDELFDFVADCYGEDRDAVDDFMEELYKSNPKFKTWQAEKKRAREGDATIRGGAKIANNG